jgi:8-oxo-dGTP pyrophosphatase MutT (NUDIX family)
VREVWEETGVACELVGERGVPIERPRQLVRPIGIQLEDIGPNHQHIDLIYFARPRDPAAVDVTSNEESERAGWYSLAELPALGVNEEVRAWCRRAVQDVADARTSRPRAT